MSEADPAPARPVRFSVIVATLWRGQDLRPTLEAVLSQEHPSFEVILVDDGSAEPVTPEAVGLADERLKIVRRGQNGGISAARNTGVKEALGEFVVPLDDDDLPEPDWLSALDQALSEASASVAFCGCTIVDDVSGAELERRMPADLGPGFGQKAGVLLAGTLAVDRGLIVRIGGYAEGLECSHQTELLLRLLAEVDRVGVVDRSCLRIRRRAPGRRPESSPSKLYSGGIYVINHHWQQLRRDPHLLANFHSVVGVSAARLGRWRDSRSHLWRAIKVGGARPKVIARLMMALLPPVGRRYWGA